MSGTILVVEDDIDIRESLVEALRENGLPAIAVANGQEALDSIRSSPEPPCMILLDLMMPVMDGQTFRAEQLRDPELAKIPVVVLSAYQNLEDVTKGMAVSAILKKPPDLGELLRISKQSCL